MNNHRLATYHPPETNEDMYPYKGDKIWVHNLTWNNLFPDIENSKRDSYAFRFVDDNHPQARGFWRTPRYWAASKSWVRFIKPRYVVAGKSHLSIDRAIAHATKLAKETGVPVPII